MGIALHRFHSKDAVMAKRVSKSAVEWAKMFDCLRARQKPHARQLKNMTDELVMRVNEKPEVLPPINFAEYRKTTNNPEVIDLYEKYYSAFEIPYPKDQDNVKKIIENIYKDEMETKEELCKFWEEFIEETKTVLDAMVTVPPPEEMTQQMMNHYFPKSQLQPHKQWPGFAPVHNPKHQPDRKGVDVPGCYKNGRYDYRNVQTFNEFEREWELRIEMENKIKEEKRLKLEKEQEEAERIRVLKEAKAIEKAKAANKKSA